MRQNTGTARGARVAVRLSREDRVRIDEAVEARGATTLYLPPYSPDLNPIEQAFAKLKRLLRAAAARTREALWNVIGQSVGRFSLKECANYLAHCGYQQSGR